MSAAPTQALREQQQAFKNALLAAEAHADVPVLADHRPGVPALLGVYRHAYRARLREALAQNHPVLLRALGDEGFAELAARYAQQHPSRHPSIRWFGDRLADFMRADENLHPALADLAAMDWAMGLAFDAADAPSLSVGELSALPPEQWASLRLRAHPSVQCLNLAWAVEPAWRALQAWEPDSGDEEPAMPEPEALVHVLLVWRRGLETQWRSLGDEEAGWLRALLGGESFAELCARAAEQREPSQAPLAVATVLQQWLQDGLFTAWSA
jgi:hypothetical protein